MEHEISDQDLLHLIVEADDRALEEGDEPKGRSLSVVPYVMEKLGYRSHPFAGPGAPPIVNRILALHSSLYRSSDLAIGGVHGGIFMFRDVFARIGIPFILGRASINPFELTDLTHKQLQWLNSLNNERATFLDQFSDIFDFAGGIGNFASFKRPTSEAQGIFNLAAFQLQAAAATLSAAFDFRGAIQSAIIGAELALKGGLAEAGVDEAGRRKHWHDLASAAEAFAKMKPEFDINRVLGAIKRLPPYVENRYSTAQPSRIETGHIAMCAQYIAGEVMRQVTGFSIRVTFELSERSYPK